MGATRVLWVTMAVVVLAGCGAGSSVTGTEDGDAASNARQFGVVAAWIDPEDDRHLVFLVDGCSEGGAVTVVERPDRVTVAVAATAVEVLCTTERVEVRLEAPVGDRAVIDATDGERLELTEATFLHPQPTAPRPAADCTPHSVHEAVEHEIDGGLQAHVTGCDGTWLVVEASANACPATGEAPADGCITNQHVAYFHNTGHWTVFAFDGCDVVMREDPSFPAELCHSSP